MNENTTFGINCWVARQLGTRAAAVFGWLFVHCQRAALDAGATRGGAGWVSVSQVELGRRLHLSRHTISSILAKLSDAGLIVAANAYTDGEGRRHWREVEPLPKGAAGRERTDTAERGCPDTAKNTKPVKTANSSPANASRGCPDTAKSTGPTKAEHSYTDKANRTGSAKAESSSPANASRGCPEKASAYALRKDDAASFRLSACTQTETRKRLVFASRERLVKANWCEFHPLIKSKDETRNRLAKASRWYSIGEEGFHVMGRKSYDWQMKNQEVMLSWAACEAVCAIVGVNAAIVFQHLWFWANNRRSSAHSGRKERVWKAHSAASLSRECAFMSDDVVLDALHRLEDAGLLLRRRGRWATLWAVSDGGYTLMGQEPPAWQEGSPCRKPKLRPSSPAPAAFPAAAHRVLPSTAARVRDVRRSLSTQLNWWQVQGLRTRHLRW